ncbi:MAG: SAM-dependent methyltransferase [Desulfuromonas sp.]|nr:MAG: SAM-dependent methyltransferase [Desulfuromonas sp.]
MDETLDTLPIGNLRLFQARNGYRYSLDPVLLADFVGTGNWKRVVDLGTGSGILVLLLAELTAASELIGVERQAEMAERARRNIELNSYQERVRICEADIRDLGAEITAGWADLVVTNPPFRPPGGGRIAPDDERAAARHELAGGLLDFLSMAARLLKYGGSFALIHLAERLPEIFSEMRTEGLEPKRLRMVHPRMGEGARLVLISARKGGRPGLKVETPLYIYNDREGDDERNYTDEVLRIYGRG